MTNAPSAAIAPSAGENGHHHFLPGANGVVELTPFEFLDRLANLERAIRRLPGVFVFDNTAIAGPFQLDTVYRNGTRLV